jgi:eukaryotic-like serine/threonine-protein kinase
MAGPDPAAPVPPRTIDFKFGTVIQNRFHIMKPAGEGSMGVVYQAWDEVMEEVVALKFPRREPDAEAMEQLRREVRMGRTIGHPQIIHARDIGKHDDRITFVHMEFVEGQNLEELLSGIKRLPKEAAIPYAVQLSTLVEHLHKGGVVHRDLKPANIMLDSNHQVRIMDLGVAVFADMARSEIIGTPHYMAPEQILGRPAKPPADIYAVGLILFELFTGHRCLDGNTWRAILDSQTTASTLRPSHLVSDLEPGIDYLVSRCMNRDPAQRPTATELRQQWDLLGHS